MFPSVIRSSKKILSRLPLPPRLPFRKEFAELLVNKGAKADYRDPSGASVLIHASHARMTKVVTGLLAAPVESGVDKDSASDEGVTSLIAASMKVRCV